MSDADSLDSIQIEKQLSNIDQADKSFLTSIQKSHKNYEGKVSFFGRMINLIEIPLVIFSAINIGSLVATFLSEPEYQIVGKIVSMAFTSINMILIALKRFSNFDSRREKAITTRNELQKIKLLYMEYVVKKDPIELEKLRQGYINLIGNYDE